MMNTSLPSYWRNYKDLREANTTSVTGIDKYFHCKANCQATKVGLFGSTAATGISNAREFFDQYVKGDSPQACEADQAANRFGRQGASTGKTCQAACQKYRPFGLPNNF